MARIDGLAGPTPKDAPHAPTGRAPNPHNRCYRPAPEVLARLADLALEPDAAVAADWEWLGRTENRSEAEFVRRFRAAVEAYRATVVPPVAGPAAGPADGRGPARWLALRYREDAQKVVGKFADLADEVVCLEDEELGLQLSVSSVAGERITVRVFGPVPSGRLLLRVGGRLVSFLSPPNAYGYATVARSDLEPAVHRRVPIELGIEPLGNAR